MIHLRASRYGGQARVCLVTAALLVWAATASAQTANYSGFLEGRGFLFPQKAPNDSERVVGDGLFRNELTLRPSDWFSVAAGLDLRANSHDQVEDEWRLDWDDRTAQRPRAAVRRLAATIASGRFTLDAGKQFIRWGRADIIYPTDRFAPRDYLNVVDSDFLPVIAVRASVRFGSETLEGVWSPQLTPSRLPLLDQRWTAVPSEASGLAIVDAGSVIPGGSQFGARWRHTGSRLETAVSVFDGYNHHPDIDARLRAADGAIDILRVHPRIRMLGGDLAVPGRVITLKAEVAFVASPPETSDDYLLYVIEIERQLGEWLVDVGYAGERTLESRVPRVFAPDRSMARSVIGRAAYTLDPTRIVILEGAVRQSGDGYYGKLEYSQGFGRHWRLTLTGVGLAGDDDDFLGQYRRNSHASLSLRYSF
jgi:hypothetical protein